MNDWWFFGPDFQRMSWGHEFIRLVSQLILFAASILDLTKFDKVTMEGMFQPEFQL